MVRPIFVLIFAFLITISTSDTPQTELFQILLGFNDQLAIESDAIFDNCEENPLLSDVIKTFTDLRSPNPDPFQLVSDVMAVYGDYAKIKGNCPQLAMAYAAYFSKFGEAVMADPQQTSVAVMKNLFQNLQGIDEAMNQARSDAENKDFYNFGGSMGKIIAFALAGYLP